MSGDRLASQFKQLERASGGATADAQLLQLKQRMGMLASGAPAASKQLAAGAAEPAPAPAAEPAKLAAGEQTKTAEADLIAEIEGLREPKPRS